ncbi:DUF1049 domain-containing protein [Streptomyces sp. GC420]|uniref:DUF1049 domain-containing protein n=1 Tax=Streptomyces sp. GC420 TaxID=2697568 RepID=UPI001414F04F|nr:DUF1049 domain-containing protein [Streptomyces sp. GC420]NBM21000.1 DUF1049 domain-containing protein [Streptomyces sp. GC420]
MSRRTASGGPGGRTATGRGGGYLTPGRIVAGVPAVLGIVFIAENTQDVRIRVIIREVVMPLWAALLVMGVIGLLCGIILFWRRR